MGLNLRVEVDRVPLRDACASAFALYGPGDPAAPPDLRFAFSVAQGRLSVSDALRESEPTFRISATSAAAEMGGSRLEADPARGLAHGRFTPSLLSDLPLLRHHFLQFALSVMLPPRGFLGVHAAALARNGRAALLRGPSGCGKSVLAYAGSRRMQLLSDSTVWIAPDGRWWGWPRLHLPPSARALFPELPDGPIVSIGGRPKIEVAAACAVVSAAPGPVILLGSAWREGAAGDEAAASAYDRRIAALCRGGVHLLDRTLPLDRRLDSIAALLQVEHEEPAPVPQ